MTEPEASEGLLTAITNYRIETLPCIKKHFNPDTACPIARRAEKSAGSLDNGEGRTRMMVVKPCKG